MIAFYIPGKPRGKERPRFGKGKVYNRAETESYERLVKRCFAKANRLRVKKKIRTEESAANKIPCNRGGIYRELRS